VWAGVAQATRTPSSPSVLVWGAALRRARGARTAKGSFPGSDDGVVRAGKSVLRWGRLRLPARSRSHVRLPSRLRLLQLGLRSDFAAPHRVVTSPRQYARHKGGFRRRNPLPTPHRARHAACEAHTARPALGSRKPFGTVGRRAIAAVGTIPRSPLNSHVAPGPRSAALDGVASRSQVERRSPGTL